MKSKLTTIFLASLMMGLAVLGLMTGNASSTPTNCHAVQFVFARGSGSELGGREYTSFKTELEAAIKEYAPTLNYGFYELGSAPQAGYQYPAVNVEQINILLSTKVSSGNSGKFGQSVRQGMRELQAYIKQVHQACPETKFVLGGYSQGAMVITKTLPSLDPEQIIYAATFGDPKLYLPEGYGNNPAACQGYDFSVYRINVPDCHTAKGILGALKPYLPTGFAGKLGAWCNDRDFMCGSAFDFSSLDSLLRAHLAYSDDGSFAEASRYILRAINWALPKSALATPLVNTTSGPDVVFMIDTSGSMSLSRKVYIDQAFRTATKVIVQGGRIALYEFRDLDDPFDARQLCDFTCTLDQFKTLLGGLTFQGGGVTYAESVLGSSLQTMNSLNWRFGANKSLVIMTDDTFHNPDRDGTTLQQVVQRSLEIDPVNFYILTNQHHVADYTELAQLTGGQVYNIDDQIAKINQDIAQRTLCDQSPEPETASASVSQLTTTPTAEGIKLDFNLGGAYAFITINDAPLGLTDQTSLIISDVPSGATITVTPISANGRTGTPASISLQPSRGSGSTTIFAPSIQDGFIPKAPNAGAH